MRRRAGGSPQGRDEEHHERPSFRTREQFTDRPEIVDWTGYAEARGAAARRHGATAFGAYPPVSSAVDTIREQDR
jgi:hypothetical protein